MAEGGGGGGEGGGRKRDMPAVPVLWLCTTVPQR